MVELEYIQKGDFLYPNLAVDEPTEDIGKYGRMRRKYLIKHQEEVYTALLLAGELHPHLVDMNRQVKEQIEQIVSAMAAKNGVTESLKAVNQMEWVQRMNNFTAAAEEIILSEMVCC